MRGHAFGGVERGVPRAHTVHRHDRLIRRVLQVAIEKQKLQANPCDRVTPPSVPKTEMTFLSWEDAVALAEAHKERYRPLIYLAVDSGMRWSELVGRPPRARARRGDRGVFRRPVRGDEASAGRSPDRCPRLLRRSRLGDGARVFGGDDQHRSGILPRSMTLTSAHVSHPRAAVRTRSAISPVVFAVSIRASRCSIEQ